MSTSLEEICCRWVSTLIELRGMTPAVDCEALERLRMQELIERDAAQAQFAHDAPSLAARLGLNDQDIRVLLLLFAVDCDPLLDARLRQTIPQGLIGSVIRALLFEDDPAGGALDLGARGMLQRLGVMERDDGVRDAHASRQTWVLAPRVVTALRGGTQIDPEVIQVATRKPRRAVSPAVPPGMSEAVRSNGSVVVAVGMPSLGRRTLLEAALAEAGEQALSIDASRLARDGTGCTRQLRAIARECRLLGRVPLLCNIDALVDDKDTTRLDLVGSELVPLIDGPVLVTCGVNRPRLDWGRPVIVVEMAPPTTAQRAQLWQQALGQGTPEDADLLATRYPLAPALIVRAAEAAKARAHGRQLAPDDIYAGIRAVLDDRLGQFAKRVTVTQTWDDLVLPAEQVDAIVELMARIRERRRVYEEWGFAAKVGKGLGVSALFSGPPGTGKTMVAALIARDLGLELYQVDVSKLVSKYIGETEKHLAALFDAAEAGHAVLLFDEADALFGKRTDVKSSNDRYANLETNYLLQRLESFTGICLLTSNHESHIDPAFQRRLSLHLRFDLPDAEQRAELWRAMLPDAAPVASTIDLDALGRKYAMSGGYIRNAALRAAFLAANDGTAITAQHLERAARLEYEGMGKIASN